jgi:hypothetical protein
VTAPRIAELEAVPVYHSVKVELADAASDAD